MLQNERHIMKHWHCSSGLPLAHIPWQTNPTTGSARCAGIATGENGLFVFACETPGPHICEVPMRSIPLQISNKTIVGSESQIAIPWKNWFLCDWTKFYSDAKKLDQILWYSIQINIRYRILSISVEFDRISSEFKNFIHNSTKVKTIRIKIIWYIL